MTETPGRRRTGVSRRFWIVTGMGALSLAGVAGGEYWGRRSTEQKLYEALEINQQLQQRMSDVLSMHGQMKQEMAQERERIAALTEELSLVHGQLESTKNRLSEETRTAQVLQNRLSQMQRHVDQIQGELAVALEHGGESKTGKSQAVEIERIVVSDAVASQLTGRVVSIHDDWDFVVINLGWDNVKIGDMLSIFRDAQLLAKARVDRVQENVCAATILPEWDTNEVHINDLVRPL